MKRIYRGLPKPGHAVIEGRSLSGTPGTPVRSPFFARHLGFENVLVPGVGDVEVNGRRRARPVAVLTDLLQRDPAGRPGGLVDEQPGGADEASWLSPLRMLLGRLAEQRLLTVLPADQHLNPDWLDRDASTRHTLRSGLLTGEELMRVRSDPALSAKLDAEQRLTVGEYERVFGAVVDKEDRNFLPHCYEGVVEYISTVRALLERQAVNLKQQVRAGSPMPIPWLYPDFKTGLSCLSAPDRRGLGGNALREILLASQADQYFDGASRSHDRLAIIGGTAHEYSVSELARFLIDLDYTVVLAMSCVGGLGIDAKLATAARLRERYGRKLFATYGWPLPELLGPAPAGWHDAAAAVQREDVAFHSAWREEQRQQHAQGASMRTSLGEVVLHDDAGLRGALL